MKKQIIFGLWATVVALCTITFTSCEKDELTTTQTTRIVIKKPQVAQAMGDEVSVDYLSVRVYKKGSTTRIEGLNQDIENAFADGSTQTLNLDLIKGQSYDIYCWAQSSACKVYSSTVDYATINIDYTGIQANQANHDAFRGMATIEVGTNSAFNGTITLTRPLAQLNFCVPKSEWEKVVNMGTAITQSSVKVSVVSKNYNTQTNLTNLNSTGHRVNDLVFAAADIPTEDILIDVDGDGTPEAYKHLAMTYILPDDGSIPGVSTLVNTEFTIHVEGGNDIVIKSENTPIRRNYRTNVIGSLFNTTTFQVTVDAAFDGLANTDLTTGEETVKPVAGKGDDGETEYYETLADAITAGEDSVALPEGEYDFNGFTNLNASTDMTIVGTSPEDTKINIPTIGVNGASATFENVTIVTSNASYSGIQHVGAVTLKNCIIEGTYWCYSGDKKTTFINCTFKQTDPTIYNVWTYGSDADFIDCEFFCAGKSVLIYHEGDPLSTVTFTNCKFYASAPANDGKAAIEMTSTAYVMGNCPFDVTITNCTAEGFDNGSKSGNPLYNIKDNCGPEYGKLTVDGVAIALPLQP